MNEKIKELFSRVEHRSSRSLIQMADARRVADQAMFYGTAAVALPASYVQVTKRYVGTRTRVIAELGQGCGFDTSAAKAFLAADALKHGADGVAIAVNAGWIRDERWADLEAEMAMVKDVCGSRTLEAVIGFRDLTKEEQIRLCRALSEAGVDGVRISVPEGKAGLDEIGLWHSYKAKGLLICADGDVTSFTGAEERLKAGADRLVTGSLADLFEQLASDGN
jgi:deoxyribose-phosphate aldolase